MIVFSVLCHKEETCFTKRTCSIFFQLLFVDLYLLIETMAHPLFVKIMVILCLFALMVQFYLFLYSGSLVIVVDKLFQKK
jgi:hypothetical protein